MTPAQRAQLEDFGELLRTAPLNLLSRRDREQVWERHVGESALVAGAIAPCAGEHWLDLGTGGGLPGVVLAVMAPEARFTLLDARAKKINAVRGFREALGLVNVREVAGRAEELGRDPEWRGAFDGVISRAVGRLVTVAELSRGFVRDGGRIAAVRGGGVPEEVLQLRSVLGLLSVEDLQTARVEGALRETWLVTMRARGRPPQAVPRPNGVPAARPLGHGDG